MAVIKKKQVIKQDVLPPGINFQWLAQKEAESKNPGGVWVDGFYIPPGLDFSGFGPAPTAPVAPAPVQKSAAELQAEAAARANAEVNTNGDFLAAQAALYSKLQSQENQLTAAEQNAGTDYEMSRVTNERNRGLSLTSTADSLADRGLSMGGVSDKASTDVQERYNLTDLQNKTRKTQTIGQILAQRAAAKSDYEAQLQQQRQGTTNNLIQRYLTGVGDAFR
jgi:hypothetical protein